MSTREKNSLKHSKIVASIDAYGSTSSDTLLPGSSLEDTPRRLRYWPILLVVVLLVVMLFILNRIAWHDTWLAGGGSIGGGSGNRTRSS